MPTPKQPNAKPPGFRRDTVPDIWVYAEPNDTYARVKWSFTRQQVMQRFEMYMHTSPLVVQPVRDGEFTIKTYTGRANRSAKTPAYITNPYKITHLTYAKMIKSIIAIIRKHDMITDAQTNGSGYAIKADKDLFVFPTWRWSKQGYNVQALRTAISNIEKPAGTNGHAEPELALPAPTPAPPEVVAKFQTDLPVPGNETVLDIIAQHAPVPEEDPTYLQGRIDGYKIGMSIANDMSLLIGKKIIAMRQAGASSGTIKVYEGYQAVLTQVFNELARHEGADHTKLRTIVPEGPWDPDAAEEPSSETGK